MNANNPMGIQREHEYYCSDCKRTRHYTQYLGQARECFCRPTPSSYGTLRYKGLRSLEPNWLSWPKWDRKPVAANYIEMMTVAGWI